MKVLSRPAVHSAPRTAQPLAIGRVQRSVPRAAKTEELVSTNGVAATTDSHASTASTLQLDELSDIIRLVHDTDIVEFELKSKRFSLSVRKKEAIHAEQAAALQALMPAHFAAAAPAALPAAAPAPVAPAPAPAAPAPAPAASAPAPAAPAAASAPKGVEITSPMAGTFYRKPAPGDPAFCKEGDKVKKGQTVCIIEAMKLMNEIEAEVGGEVVKFLLENGQPVSVGQPIMIVRP